MGEGTEGGCSTVMAVFVTFAIGAYAGYIGGTYYQRHAAVEAGVARYEVNPRTGEMRFVYGRSATTK
jgi:hypothetical protein